MHAHGHRDGRQRRHGLRQQHAKTRTDGFVTSTHGATAARVSIIRANEVRPRGSLCVTRQRALPDVAGVLVNNLPAVPWSAADSLRSHNTSPIPLVELVRILHHHLSQPC